MKSIDDSVVLITGSTDGIGKRVAHDLAIKGTEVLIHGRSPDKGAYVTDEIIQSTGNERLQYFNADFSSLNNVRQLAHDLEGINIDILINNAGIGAGPPGSGREVSREGYELRMAINYLAPFLLTHLMIPNLQGSSSRVINVASLGQRYVDLNDLMMIHNYDGWDAYGQSKLALIMFTIDMAARLNDTSITINAVHPGSLLNTNMVKEIGTPPQGDVQEGADSIMFLATSPDLEGITGRFFDHTHETEAYNQAYDSVIREELYHKSLELTGIRELIIQV
ncbi:MAG: SDR family NAD(P)-dependent oxidoreductase [Euryarchaeota archaeon]|nr:SDR family NAD(P)-dependent oxidoreductase [Euryarchaeota archaeon]